MAARRGCKRLAEGNHRQLLRAECRASAKCFACLPACFLIAWWLVCIQPARAHQDPAAPVPAVRALKTDAALQLDGVLDEPFWQQAEMASRFIDTRTQQPAALQTQARVAYTRTHLYLAVECLDDRVDQIRASERREDRSFDGDDWVEVHLDPLHNHQSKYAFFANPLGTRSDASEGPSGVFNRGWTAEWECAAKVHPDRWTFEMKIPLTVMNYERRNDQRWGLNFTRMQRRTDTTSFWSFNPTDVYKPRQFGHLTGLDLADTEFDRNWEVTPYTSVRTDFNGDTDTFVKAGLDFSFRLTPSITTAWTLFPDFGQVEADDDTIELRDTERFLSEKRMFFREGDELLRMPHQLYYSRRFTDIDAGVNISGQWAGNQFTFVDVLGDTSHDGVRYGNSAVLRVLRNYGERSNVGFYVGDSELEDGHSRVLSTDGYYFVNDAWRVRYQASVASDLEHNDAGQLVKDRWDYLGNATLIYYRYPWQFNGGVVGITKEFNPVLGYIPRRDIFGPNFLGRYYRESGERWYKSVSLEYQSQYYLNEDQATSIHDHGVYGQVVLPNDLGLRASHREDYHAPYHNRRTSLGVSLFTSSYWKLISLGYALGTFETMDYQELGLGKNFKPFERWPIRYEFVVRLEDYSDGRQEVPWLNRVVFDYYFTDKMWLKTSLQHRNDDLHNISVIYGWEFRPRTQWYLVYNNVREADDPEDSHSIFSKITYTF
jgi:hypothetical protein